ncbi:dephospho-CoA kinase [Rhodomicrobium vannielii ATCC 17100]|uniref:Dephospho-CoA kinase n=1 Tax=Rhodomicrobium vannielii (strain ATCC 17100 / DSM 162 / LMG 4299 / NCIMB 10020 / ATH 3.1.1) TaxID=648757 RepID=E3I7I0_RHOVT|nr:dephospho-CoA kinase [Rhodomicrobium vannielii]ADP71899.1 dephospho-CoA kinase [Rhodomicrobium vannielii ATCC 17100]
MIVIGMTGSIGMGKSTAAAYLRGLGIPVLDADRVVHELYAGAAVPLIEAAFPGTTAGGVVDRVALGARVLGSPEAMKRLEAIVHPLVRAAEWRFLLAEQDKGTPLSILEIPLLFETGAGDLFDAVIVVSASAEAQRERLLDRPGMTIEKLEAINARQMPDAEKRARADFVVDTGTGLEDSRRQIDAILKDIVTRPPLAYQRWAALQDI